MSARGLQLPEKNISQPQSSSPHTHMYAEISNTFCSNSSAAAALAVIFFCCFFCCIPAVTVIADGRRALLGQSGSRGLGVDDEEAKPGASTQPLFGSGITRPVIVSSCLMSMADSECVSGKKDGAGNCENSENARLICKGNEVDIEHGYCLPQSLPGLVSLESLLSSLYLRPVCPGTDAILPHLHKEYRIYVCDTYHSHDVCSPTHGRGLKHPQDCLFRDVCCKTS